MNDEIAVTLAGLTFSCRLRYPETAAFFQKPDPGAPRVGTGSVCLTESDWQYFQSNGATDSAHSEYSLLCIPFSNALLPYDRVLIHGVAMRWHEEAYLICAPSGTGKSTQARFLQELRPGEFSVICGDRPALEFRKLPSASVSSTGAEGAAEKSAHVSGLHTMGKVPSMRTSETDEISSVIVHPSPWNGKEDWKGAPAAPLAGIILLERGDKNDLLAISHREASLFMFAQFIQTAVDPDHIRRTAELVTRLLNSVPIWKLTTHDVPASTSLLLEAVF